MPESWSNILFLARDLGFLDSFKYDRLENDVTEVERMLTCFIQKLSADS